MTPTGAAAAGLAVLLCAGCAATTTPADYATTLSAQDPKWQTASCVEARAAAATYEDKRMSVATGLLLGPYGLGLLAASREGQAKKRRTLAREVHLHCSSAPLPKQLEAEPIGVND